MPKLTEEQREKAKRDLRERLIDALEESPRGLTFVEIMDTTCEAFKLANIWECLKART